LCRYNEVSKVAKAAGDEPVPLDAADADVTPESIADIFRCVTARTGRRASTLGPLSCACFITLPTLDLMSLTPAVAAV
jgi:hypothetical protein